MANTTEAVVDAGDADTQFTIMSVAKPFVFALMGDVLAQAVLDFVGVNATGRKFNAVSAIEDHPDGRTNPMVNQRRSPPSMVPAPIQQKWAFLRAGLSRFAGRADARRRDVRLSLGDQRRQPGDRRPAAEPGRLQADPDETVDLYRGRAASTSRRATWR